MAEKLISQNTDITTIGALQRAWDDANAAYEAADEAGLGLADTREEGIRRLHLKDAEKKAFRQAHFLQQAILREQPVTQQDAAILAGHIALVSSDIDCSTDEHRQSDCEALELATESLFVFVTREIGGQFGGWLGDSLRVCRNNVANRTGSPGQAVRP